jgi:flagellar FliL protein
VPRLGDDNPEYTMADAKKTEADAVVAPPPKKSKAKWIVFGAIGFLVLAGGGTAAFFMLKKPPPAEAAEAAAAPAKKKADPSAPPVYYKFDKPFTVKLATEQQDAYLQAEVQLKLLDASGNDVIKVNEPELKHKITLTLMGRKASMLASSEGVQKLANELRDTINKVVSPGSVAKEKPAEKPTEKPADGTLPKPPEKAEPAELADPSAVVQSVLFSSFIIQ